MEKKDTIRAPLRSGAAKVPMVMQLEALECGAACLTMVMAYYNKWIPLEQVRADCGVSRDGTKAVNVLNAARSYGFRANGFRFGVEALRQQGRFPCIIHWNFNHFVVLCGFKKDKAVLNDPARGTVTVTMEDFDRSFTGVCLMIEPGEQFVPSGEPRRLRTYVDKRLKMASASLAFVAATTLITALTGILSPALTRVFYDRLLTGRNPEWFPGFMIFLCILDGVQILVSVLESLYRSRLNGKMASLGSAAFLWKVFHMPMEFFSQRMAADIQDRQSANAAIADSLVNTLVPIAINACMMLLYLLVMIRYSWQLTLVGVSGVVINSFLGRRLSRKRTDATRLRMRDAGKLASATVTGIEMIESIKASGAENGYFRRWSGYQASVNSQRVRYLRMDQFLGMLPVLVSAVCSVAVSALGVRLVIRGEFTVGMVCAFQAFLTAFSAPAGSLISADRTLQEMRTNMERVDDVMDYPEDPCYLAAGEQTGYAKLSGNVELKEVSFGYARLGEPLIRNFSMSLQPGRSVALVGATGCGKSTVSRLIAGLYQPWSGQILFDGKPQSAIDRDVFTGSVAVVDQDIILFEDTVANNIKMWDQSVEDFEMILAARDAGLHQEILRRDGGYNGLLTEGGSNLSGGQRQRLEIARVLAQDPTVVIMDEATSALDARTEFEVVKAIRDRGISLIIVAHRLSTVRDCDEIIVLDHGQIVERGTHEELLALGGRYTELVTTD